MDIVDKYFPSTGPEALSAATVANMLTLCILPGVPDNFLALQIGNPNLGSGLDSETSVSLSQVCQVIVSGLLGWTYEIYPQRVKCPFAHAMVQEIVEALLEQKLKYCDMVSVASMLKTTGEVTKGQPVSIATVTYGLSLVRLFSSCYWLWFIQIFTLTFQLSVIWCCRQQISRGVCCIACKHHQWFDIQAICWLCPVWLLLWRAEKVSRVRWVGTRVGCNLESLGCKDFLLITSLTTQTCLKLSNFVLHISDHINLV